MASGIVKPSITHVIANAPDDSSQKREIASITKSKSVEKGIDLMRKNSNKYDNLMKERKDELRRKRGALELNSDQGMELELKNQSREVNLPSSISTGGRAAAVSASYDRINFKSKLHS